MYAITSNKLSVHLDGKFFSVARKVAVRFFPGEMLAGGAKLIVFRELDPLSSFVEAFSILNDHSIGPQKSV